MYSKIIQKRLRGVKRSDRDITNDLGVEGKLSLHVSAGHTVMRLQPHDTTVFDGDPMRALHEPVCAGITGAYMTWRGFQRPGSADTPAFMQEWLVEVLTQP